MTISLGRQIVACVQDPSDNAPAPLFNPAYPVHPCWIRRAREKGLNVDAQDRQDEI